MDKVVELLHKGAVVGALAIGQSELCQLAKAPTRGRASLTSKYIPIIFLSKSEMVPKMIVVPYGHSAVSPFPAPVEKWKYLVDNIGDACFD